MYVDLAVHSRPMLEVLAVQVESLPGVEDVAYQQFDFDFMLKAEAVIRGLSILMGGAAILVIYFSIILTTHFRREAIQVMRLMGASKWYIRAPLICQGTVLGVLGSVSGIGCFYGLFYLFTLQLGELELLAFNQCFVVVVEGILLGLLGSLLPLRKYDGV